MKSVFISLFFVFLFASNVFAVGFCGNSILVSLVKNADGSSSCPETAPDYPYALDSGCTVDQKSVVGCLYVYKICCGDITKKYEDSTVQTLLASSVEVGREEQAAADKYQEFKDSAVQPACALGFMTTSEMMGYVSLVTPSYSTNDYTKSDVALSAWSRVGCSKFTNTTTVVLEPIQSGGGTTAESLVELQAINTALSTIKTVLDNIPNSTNPLLTDIKTLLQTGLNFNSANLEAGINNVAYNTDRVNVNTAAGNEILTAINNKLTQNCTTVWDPNGGTCTTGDFDRNPSTPDTTSCTGANVTTCEGLDVSDSASLAKLQEIKDAIIAGGGGTMSNYSGTVNIDLTETNSLLTQVKEFFSGSSTLSQHTDTSASKTAYSSSYFAEGVPTSQTYSNEFNSFVSDMKATPLYGLMGGFFNGVPTSGVSVVSFNGGRYGSHSYDFASWGSILTVIKALVLIIFAAMSMKIIFLKGGSG